MADARPDIDIVGSFVRLFGTDVLGILLADRTTKHNVIWADDEYSELGEGYQPCDDIVVEKITGFRSGVIKTRTAKDAERQAERTRRKAEVFTPSWLTNQMNNVFDDEWFGRTGVFNREVPGGWETNRERVEFSEDKGRGWRDFVDRRMLEITCGEGPFLCSRYDATTGERIPVEDRTGILDRKLRVVSENADDEAEWLDWAIRALEATYGYEYQGDNLVVARINVALSFAEHMERRWGRMPGDQEIKRAARVVAWNIWQMDGKNGCAPGERTDRPPAEETEPRLFDLADYTVDTVEAGGQGALPLYDVPCMIYDWRARKPQTFNSLKG